MARIADQEINRLKQDVSLVRVIESAGYTLVKQGKDLAMRCPLHEGDDTPSFIVTPSKNVWHCFGCQAGGSVIDWVMATRKVSFRHAAELLKQESPALSAPSTRAVRSAAPGLAAPADGSQAAADAALLGQVIDHYQTTLQGDADGLAYLASRGLTHPDLIATFRLGLGNRTLGYLLPQKNRVKGAAVRGALQRIGLLRASGHEHFNGSLVIPVCDAAGEIAEVYGRKIAPEHQLREGTALHLYLPGPHRGVFNLAGWCGTEEVILCEALIDALTFWCAGYRHVTSAFGVSGFTDELLQTLVREGVRRVLIAYDRDEAGDTAAAKLAPVLMAHGLEPYRVLFPKGLDANAYAQKLGRPAKSLGLVLRQAQAMRENAPMRAVPVRGEAVAVVEAVPRGAAAAETSAVQAVAIEAPLAASVTVPPEPCSPAPPVAADIDATVRDRDVTIAFGERRYRIRGMEKNLAYDVLRVNVLASTARGLHVDTFDLYQAKARAIFVKQASVELGVEEAVIQRDLGQVLLKLETLQEKAITQATTPTAAVPALGEAETAEALALLRDPTLIERIVADVAAIGVVGEDSNALVGYLACVSRKLDKPLAILIQSTSAAGKSTVMDALLSLMPEAERVHYSAMTGQSLFYLGEQAMKHKILAIAEEEGVRQAAYALKLLQSQGELTIASTGKDPATGQLVTQEYRVEGPVMLFLTTTAIDIDEELLNRCLVLTINESREQTAAIHQRQRTARTLAGLLATQHGEAVRRVHRAAQTLLRPLAVVNPYAEQLTFRSESTRLRRDHAKYLTLIDSIALLHQHQRPVRTVEHAGETIEYIEATVADIALANRLAHEVLGRSLDELPPQTRRVLGVLDTLVRERMQTHALTRADVRFTRADARTATGMRDTQVRVHLDRLVALDYVLLHAGRNGARFVYELAFDGDVASEAAQTIGLVDVAVLSASTAPTSRGETADLAGGLRPARGALAASPRRDETALSAGADAASSLVAALDPQTALPDPRTRSRRNGSAVALA
jgi:DNA primase catalytic core